MLTPLTKYIIENLTINYIKPIVIFMIFMIFNSYNINKELIAYDLYNLYYIYFSDWILFLIIVPVFIFWLLDLLSLYDNDKVLLKFHLLKNWWLDKTKALIILILFYVFLINFIFLFSVLMNGLVSYITFQFIKFFIIGFLLQIIGFFIIGFLYLTLRYFLNNRIVSSVLTYLILIIPLLINGLFYKRIYNLFDFMFLKNLNDYSYIQSLFLLTIVLILLLYINIITLRKKDFLWGRLR